MGDKRAGSLPWQIKYPLSVRSSSLLEDAQFQPYAGLYRTYMIPNNDPDPALRLGQLLTAVKLVYASTYYEGPKVFSRSIANQPQLESMAVVIQQLTGAKVRRFFLSCPVRESPNPTTSIPSLP
jgi:hypothetical protein